MSLNVDLSRSSRGFFISSDVNNEVKIKWKLLLCAALRMGLSCCVFIIFEERDWHSGL